MAPLPARVALVFDYASAWAWAVQPQGADFDYFRMVLCWYRAARELGLSLDILPPDTTGLSAYDLVLMPGLARLQPPILEALAQYDGRALIGPRTNAKAAAMATPVPLPPNLPGMDLRVTAVESLPPGASEPLSGGGQIVHWREHLVGGAEVLETDSVGGALVVRAGALTYLGGWPDGSALRRLIGAACAEQGIETFDLPEGLRLRDTATHRFAFNYSPEPVVWEGQALPPAGVVWVALATDQTGGVSDGHGTA
jgi:beta-galactosidase